MATATQRGVHRLDDDAPWILDDPFALQLVGPVWTEIYGRLDQEAARRGRGLVLARSRYAEDRLLATQHSQYVVLGAGLDSFAWRRPDVLRNGTRVFEVDHPDSQAWKHSRAVELALPRSDGHIFAPVDFETSELDAGLEAVGFDRRARTLFSWLGVSMYLTTEAIERTLRVVRDTPSEIVWTYWPTDDELDVDDQLWRDRIAARQAETGEPIQTKLRAREAEALMKRCGFEVVEHPSAEDLERLYFAGRDDGLRPSSGERIIVGRAHA
jgi:methyltransferase (TIGR00027 family)